MVTIAEIRKAAQGYAESARALHNVQEAMAAEISAIERKYSGILEKAMQEAGEARQMVVTLLRDKSAPGLFIKPRTTEISGVKVGFKKAGDTLSYHAMDTIALIRKKLPKKAEMLLKTETSIINAGLKALAPAELALIGVSVNAGADEPVISFANKEIDKAVTAYGKGAA